MKSARHIYNQLNKSYKIPEKTTFHPEAVNTSNIRDGVRHYSGNLFVPIIATNFMTTSRLTFSINAGYFKWIAVWSYGTTFEAVMYNANLNIFSILFLHFVATES